MLPPLPEEPPLPGEPPLPAGTFLPNRHTQQVLSPSLLGSDLHLTLILPRNILIVPRLFSPCQKDV